MTRGHNCVAEKAEPPSPSISTDSEYDYLFKLVVIGDTGVGKSSLLMRFVDDSFVDSHIATIGVDFKIKTINIDQKVVKLQVWDTAGQERFRTITSSFYRGAHGVLLVYDVTEPKTFESIKSWLQEVELCASERTRRLMVGNKCDMIDKKMVTYDTAKALADQMNFPLIETSAKTSTNVEQAFVLMAADMMEMVDKHKMDPLTPTLHIGEGKPAEKKKGFIECCS